MQGYLVLLNADHHGKKKFIDGASESRRARVDGEAFPTGDFALTEDKLQDSSRILFILA